MLYSPRIRMWPVGEFRQGNRLVSGISNRYLRVDFKDENIDIDLDSFDDGDDPWDLQAGHGTHVTGIIYARLLRQDRIGRYSTEHRPSGEVAILKGY